MNDHIVLLRLTDGTDVIGTQISSGRKDIQLDNALEIVRGQVVGSGDPFLYFSKYSPYSKEFDVLIPRDQIISISEEPLESLIEYYDWFLNKIKKYWKKTAEEEFSIMLRKLKYLDKVQEKPRDSDVHSFTPGKYQIH